MYYLFLDDERYPKQVTWVDLPLYDWTIVRNYNEFVKIITKQGLPKAISFDHDLAIEHYPFMEPDGGISNPTTISYESYREKTGYDAAKWLVEYCRYHKTPLPEYYIHTMNPVGRENIRVTLNEF